MKLQEERTVLAAATARSTSSLVPAETAVILSPVAIHNGVNPTKGYVEGKATNLGYRHCQKRSVKRHVG